MNLTTIQIKQIADVVEAMASGDLAIPEITTALLNTITSPIPSSIYPTWPRMLFLEGQDAVSRRDYDHRAVLTLAIRETCWYVASKIDGITSSIEDVASLLDDLRVPQILETARKVVSYIKTVSADKSAASIMAVHADNITSALEAALDVSTKAGKGKSAYAEGLRMMIRHIQTQGQFTIMH